MPAGTPYAPGRFRDTGGCEFCGVVIGAEVVPLAALPPAETSIEALLNVMEPAVTGLGVQRNRCVGS